MTTSASESTWRFVRIGLVVTGEGERDFLTHFFRAVEATGHAKFCPIYKAGQRSAMSEKQIVKYGKRGKIIPSKDETIVLAMRRFVAKDNNHAIWIDDLESARRQTAQSHFDRMKKALDTIIGHQANLRSRCSVHFLVNMLEAYYFAQASIVNEVLGTTLADHVGDCENISHPKNELKRLAKASDRTFDETTDGAKIVPKLDLQAILSNPLNHCALRTLVAWCWEAIDEPRTNTFQLLDGLYWDVTSRQLQLSPRSDRTLPLGDENPYSPGISHSAS